MDFIKIDLVINSAIGATAMTLLDIVSKSKAIAAFFYLYIQQFGTIYITPKILNSLNGPLEYSNFPELSPSSTSRKRSL